MDKAEIEARVRKVLAEQLAVDEAQVVPDARFAEDLNADSLDLVEAVLALEEEWNIEIPEDEMDGVKTVGQAVALVAGRSSGSPRERRIMRETAGSSSPASARSRRSGPVSRTSGRGSRRAERASGASSGSTHRACRSHSPPRCGLRPRRLAGPEGDPPDRPLRAVRRSPRPSSRGRTRASPRSSSDRGGVVFATGIGGVETLPHPAQRDARARPRTRLARSWCPASWRTPRPDTSR